MNSLRHLFDDQAGRDSSGAPACGLEIEPLGCHTYTQRPSEVTCPDCKTSDLYRSMMDGARRSSRERIGDPIRGSRLFRAYCAGCGQPMRVAAPGHAFGAMCEKCAPQQAWEKHDAG